MRNAGVQPEKTACEWKSKCRQTNKGASQETPGTTRLRRDATESSPSGSAAGRTRQDRGAWRGDGRAARRGNAPSTNNFTRRRTGEKSGRCTGFQEGGIAQGCREFGAEENQLGLTTTTGGEGAKGHRAVSCKSSSWCVRQGPW